MTASPPEPEALPVSITQPGPAGDPLIAVQCGLVEFDMDVPADEPLGVSLPRDLARRGMAAGYVRIRDAAVAALTYVIPGIAHNSDHVVWYSKTFYPSMPGRIIDAGIDCGSYGSEPFFHCHGMFEDAEGCAHMGHFLVETCVPSQPFLVQAIGFQDAHFDRVYDPETHFEMFKPKAVSPAPDDAGGLLVRIGPNVDICTAVAECCRQAGWTCASVHGVGSLIGAHFTDGRVMESFATEAMITAGHVNLGARDMPVDLDICLVGLDGRHMCGKLSAGNNPVLITAELVLQRDDCA